MPETPQPETVRKAQARFTSAQVAILVAFAFALAGIIIAAALADHTRSHFLWVILAGMGWTQAIALTVGYWLFREAHIMLARHREAVVEASRQPAVLEAIAEVREDIADLRRQVAAVNLAFESGREVGRAEGSGLRMIGQRPMPDGQPRVG